MNELKDKVNFLRIEIIDYMELLDTVDTGIKKLEREIGDIKTNTTDYKNSLRETKKDLDNILLILDKNKQPEKVIEVVEKKKKNKK